MSSSRELTSGEVGSSLHYAMFHDSNEDDLAEVSRVEGILTTGIIEEDAEPEPEGPPATQTTIGLSSTNSPHGSRTSFNSCTSMPPERSQARLGKRRASDDRDVSFAIPGSKFVKVGGEGGAGRVTLRTVQSDPSSSCAKPATDGPAPEPGMTGMYIISHSATVQARFEGLRIPWGVQYEIARGVSTDQWSWNTVTDEKLKKLRGLKGLNVESAPKVAAVLLDKTEPRLSRVDNLLWQELDCEQSALVENQDRGLGLKGEWSGVPSWYGGKIQQTCHLQRVSEATFKLTLGKMEMRRSHRFARFLGSRRLLQIKLPESFSDRTAEKEFLNQKFVLCGRVFQVFAAKEEKAYAMEVGEDYDRLPCKSEGDFYRLSLEEFVARHSPLHLNAAQPVSKFNARFDLGLSTSRPVLHFFLPELIEIIDDQYAPLDDPARKVPPEKIYTDGCGFMNGAALKVIKDTLGLDALPCAVQGRVFGSKGVWVLHPEHADVYGDELPRIWIRRSQQKVQLAMDMDPGELEALHPVHFIFDLVAVPRVSTSPHLNRHTIANLHHNGVPVSAFAELMRTDVDKMIVPLMQIKGPFAMPLLWRNVDNNEGVTRQRILQLALGAQRVLGLASRNEVPEDDEDVEDDTDEVTSSDAVNPLVLSGSRYLPGGKPISVAERFMRLIGAGFTPEEEYTHDEYQKVRDRVLKAFFDNLRLPLRASAEAFIVPDPTGKLRENEIYFRSSTLAFEDSPNIYDCHLMLGDCLLYRNPARLASDVRKVRAVDVPELVLYKDVIVVPCKGPVSLPSMLAGGDVDGDTAVCIWDPALVKPFTNAELVTVPDGFKEENFEPEGEIVAVQTLWEDIDPARRSDAQERSVILQRHLVSGVSASRTGLYSKYHDLAMFMFGYAHEQTQRIALMFNFILDSRKSGMVVKPDIFIADKRRFDYDIPECMGESSLAGNPRRPLRKEGLGRFVLEQLQDAAKEIEGNVKKRCETQLSGLAVKKDADIVALWKQYSDVPLLQDETAAVRDFVNDCYQKWLSIWGRSPSKRDRVFYGSKKEAQESRSKNDASRRAVAAEFNEGPDPARTSVLRKLGLLDKAMAACAYAAGRKFAFDVAFTQLTLIKAEKCGIAPTTELMSNFLTMPASAVKVLTSRLEVTGG